jgi:Uncharacterized conserved protein
MVSLRRAGKYGIILLGSAILAFGLYNVHAQCGITEGGVLGASLLLRHWLKISPALSSFIMDSLFFLLALKHFGRGFLRYSLTASIGFSAVYALLERFPPLLPSLASWPLLAALCGGLFVGIGCGLIVRIGGAAGGDDALAMLLAKKLQISIGKSYLIGDLAVLLLSLSYIPAVRIGFSLVTVLVSSAVIELVCRLGKRRPAYG